MYKSGPLRHPSINRTHIDTAMHSPNAEIRHIAAMHHAASPQHVLNHIHNPETSMAHKIDAINRAPSMHESGLHGLLRHHDSAIQSAAHDALKVRTTPIVSSIISWINKRDFKSPF